MREKVLEVLGPLAVGMVGSAVLEDVEIMYRVVLANSVKLLIVRTDLVENRAEIEVNDERIGDHGVICREDDIRRVMARDSFEAIPGRIAAVAIYRMKGKGDRRIYVAAPTKTWAVGEVTGADESVV